MSFESVFDVLTNLNTVNVNQQSNLSSLKNSSKLSNYGNMDVRHFDGSFNAILLVGSCHDIDSNWRQCMENTPASKFFTFPTVDISCNITCDDSGDSAINKCLVSGWDQSYNEVSELADLSGNNTVALTKSYYRIKSIIVTSSAQASQPFMDGLRDNIYVSNVSNSYTAGVPDNDFIGICDRGISLSKPGYYHLEAGKKLYPISVLINSETTASKVLNVIVQFKNVDNNIWYTIADNSFNNSATEFDLTSTPPIFDADHAVDVRVCVRRSLGSSSIDSCSVSIHFIEEC